MEYTFRTIEWNIIKGLIGERLAKSFIRNTLAPRLVKEEGWDYIQLSNNDYKQHAWVWNTKLFTFDQFREDFIVHRFYPTQKLLSKYADVIGVLLKNHCTPDGLLLKLKGSGRTKRLKENTSPVAKLKVESSSKFKDRIEVPIVDGTLEVVEIKCGRKARLMPKQRETYNNIIAKNIPVRIIRVRIVSLDLGKFLVEERRYEKFL